MYILAPRTIPPHRTHMKTAITSLILLISFGFMVACSKTADLQTEWNEQEQTVNYLFVRGQYQKTLPIAKKMLALAEAKSNADDLDVATSLIQLGSIHSRLKDGVDIRPFFQRALDIRENIYGPDHIKVGDSLADMARAYKYTKEYDMAELYFESSLSTFEKILEPNHPDMGFVLAGLVSFYSTLKEYDKARPYYDRFLAIDRESPDYGFRATYLISIAGYAADIGQYSQSEKLFKRSIETARLTPSNPSVLALCLNNFAAFQHESGNYEQAEILYLEALAILETLPISNNFLRSSILDSLIDLYISANNTEKAREFVKRLTLFNADDKRAGSPISN